MGLCDPEKLSHTTYADEKAADSIAWKAIYQLRSTGIFESWKKENFLQSIGTNSFISKHLATLLCGAYVDRSF